MTKVIFEAANLRVKIDKNENILIVEANWKDSDNTEEWFCHLGKDLDDVIFQAIALGRAYTDDMKWYITTSDCHTFTVCNKTFNVSVTISKETLKKAILTS